MHSIDRVSKEVIMDYILEVENLEIDLNRGKERISAVDNVGFSLKKGKT